MIKTLFLILFCSSVVLCGSPKGKSPKGEARNMWRAFNEMNQSEREEMRKLQQNDRKKFRELMGKRIAEIEAREAKHRAEMGVLATSYREATTAEQKSEYKKKISDIIRSRYMKRLKSNRKNIEEMQKRVEKLDKELAAREKNVDKFVEKQTNRVLNHPKTPKRR